jgi:WD40 repeat protein
MFVSEGRIEGHLALNYSPAAAFSPDSKYLAVIVDDKIALKDLVGGGIAKELKPAIPKVSELNMESANFISPTRLVIFARGRIHPKDGAEQSTPLLAFQWYIDRDTLFGKVDMVGAGGGFSPILYLPYLGYVGMYKDGKITLWNPDSNRAAEFTFAEITHRPGLFAFSPDGHWLLLAQVESNSSSNPIVVDLVEKKFADVLQGHKASVLSMMFSRDGRKVVTAGEDGNVRVFSVGDWKLLQTLSGHYGPVHWADFSPDGKLIVSVGEDKTLRIWSADDGRLLQTLEESREPLLTAAFSPDGNSVAATSEGAVLIWQRRP